MAEKKEGAQVHGLLVLNKPCGPTSAGCLNRIKKELGQLKIGHAGTLDPMAGGVLLVLLGQATKLAPYISGGDKVYAGTMRLGLTTDTYDVQGQILAEAAWDAISPQEVREAIMSWRELTEQDIPAYSAAKHKGKPLYSLARAGREVPEKKKEIKIYEVEPLDIRLPLAGFRLKCSAGTYVRSLVHSLGKRLGCGAALAGLTRESSLPFGLKEAHDLEDVLADPEGLARRVTPLADVLRGWPRQRLSGPLAGLVKNGARLPAGPDRESPLAGRPGQRALFLGPDDEPLALVEARVEDDRIVWAILRGLWS
ncbi:MAG: tRNA pseudouridine(55) synthase TruB [Desulfovibrionaceae bacterium]|nr:tRNA pseudouridine(55) synthase TruB [Desulfovibrionaceae bacterium]